MIEFSDITANIRGKATEYLRKSGHVSCECAFADQLIWMGAYNTQIAFADGYYIVKYSLDTRDFLAMPMGDGDIKSLMNDLKKQGFDTILGATDDFVEQLSTAGVEHKSMDDRAHYDYIYTSEKLSTLSGKKLHSKRNHINKFKSLYNYSYRDLKDNFEDAITVNTQWCKQNGMCKDHSVQNEKCAAKILLNNYDELCAKGIVLYVNDKPIAYTAGTPLCDESEYFVTHLEKAIDGYEGAFTMINYLFANELKDDYKYINREDDMGLEGLRKAKLSYYPDILLKKNTVTF